MGLDGLLVHSLVQELSHRLQNARVHHIAQPRPADVVLTLRQPGANYRLLLSADPAAPRVHITETEEPNPLTPPPFCMLLRKHLDPARLLYIRQINLDRVIEFGFEVRDEMGRRAERRLIVEMMGRHSNMVLTDPASNQILDGIRHVTSEQSRYREVLPGRQYIAPPPQEKQDPLHTAEESFLFNLRHVPAPQPVWQALVNRYDGMGPDAARAILANAGLPATIQRSELTPDLFAVVWDAFHRIMQSVSDGRIHPWGACDAAGLPAWFWVFPLPHVQHEGTAVEFPTVSALLDWYYTHRQEAALLANLRQALLHPVKQAWEKVVKRIGLQEEALQAAERAEDYRLKGELLVAQQHAVPPKAALTTLPNYYSPGTEITIELNPSLSASENAQVYFRRYQKARKTQKQAQAQLEAALVERTYLESIMEVVERSETLADLTEVQEEMRAQGLWKAAAPKQRSANAVASPGYFHIRSLDGAEVFVGKNNRQNDAITMGIARPDDLWLHVRDIPGAHVLVRTAGTPVSDESLTLALHLAAYYSRARSSSQVPVDYCLRRYVRKPKGAKPGFVIYDHQKTAYITPSLQEIERLQSK